MNTTRLSKVSRLLQKELSVIFQRDSKSQYEGTMISVTTVRVSPDMSTAKVYVSIFPSDKSDTVFEHISGNASKIKHEVAQKTRNQLRRCPDMTYFLDDSLDYIEKIDELLKK
jgi:ribosome-binding factor A